MTKKTPTPDQYTPDYDAARKAYMRCGKRQLVDKLCSALHAIESLDGLNDPDHQANIDDLSVEWTKVAYPHTRCSKCGQQLRTGGS